MGSHLIDSTEMYVRTVWELEEEGIPPIRARLSERLNLSAPSVSETVSRLEDEGLLHLTEDRTLELTSAGRQLAISVMRKHRLAERLLVDVIGLEWEHVHLEACRWEHVISDDVERKLVELLDHPERCPHGNPIPGIAREDDDELTSLVDVARRGVPARVARISELLQGDVDLMKTFAVSGIRPDAELRAVMEGDLVRVEAPGGVISLSVEAAELVRVQPTS